LYDVRRKCDRSKDGPLCYKELVWTETWLNDPKTKAALGADPSKTFESCNMKVNEAFMYQGDGMHNSAALLPELINDGIRLLVYAGNAGRFFFRSTRPTADSWLIRHDVQLYRASDRNFPIG